MPRQPSSPWTNRIVGHGEEAPDQLLAHPANPKIHPRRQQQALDHAISDVGWITGVIVNQRTGHVLDGHARVGLAISRGEPTIPVTYVDIDEAAELKALATFDPIGALAATDDRMLEDLLAELSLADEDFTTFVRDLSKSDEHFYGPRQNAHDEWQGMPEFDQEDAFGVLTLKVRFLTEDDIATFAQLVGQRVSLETKSIWFPQQEPAHVTGLGYVANGAA